MKERKKVGVLGGMGPLATEYFFKEILERTEASKDQEHIDMIIYNHASLPDRTDVILNKKYEPFLSLVKEDAKALEKMGAEVIVIPCNTTHFFYDLIQEEISAPIINMPLESVRSAKKLFGAKKIGVLATTGTREGRVYEKYCEEEDMEVILPSDKNQEILMNLIYEGIKKEGRADKKKFEIVTKELYEKGAEVLIFACTELSYFKGDFQTQTAGRYLDSLSVLAEKTIEAAGAKIKQ
ncbi:MAG: amino acid racemase [bacterium]|nr:amino acid racemase [bacterium]